MTVELSRRVNDRLLSQVIFAPDVEKGSIPPIQSPSGAQIDVLRIGSPLHRLFSKAGSIPVQPFVLGAYGLSVVHRIDALAEGGEGR